MNTSSLYSFDESEKRFLLESFFAKKGTIKLQTSGMCGDIYKFDRGVNSFPRYSCIKIPKPKNNISDRETAKRFLNEVEMQLKFYHNYFVHWISDLDYFMDVPIASFRYWDNDLANLIQCNDLTQISKLSILIYVCCGLKHCYKHGLKAHQDLKPANIFIRNVRNEFRNLPDLDIYNIALLADFGLANASYDSNIFDGSRPYMAPEQWNKKALSSATDIFALGIIFYELLTGGFHPVGIKLNEYWPQPKASNSKKWVSEKHWKKWIESGCQIKDLNLIQSSNYQNFIHKMLNINPIDRPTIDEVIEFLMGELKTISNDSYEQVKFLTNFFQNNQASANLKNWEYPTQKLALLKSKL